MNSMKVFMQTFDKCTIWWKPPKRSPEPQKPTINNFEQYTEKKYLVNADLFYEKPDGIPAFSSRFVSATKDYKLYKLECKTCYPSGYEQNNKMYLEYFEADESQKTVHEKEERGVSQLVHVGGCADERETTEVSSVLVTL